MLKKLKNIKKQVVPIKKLVKSLKTYSREADLVKDIYNEKFKKSLNNSRGEFKDEDEYMQQIGKKFGKYSLRTRIKNSQWVKEGRPSNKATQWLFKEVFKDSKKYKYKKNIMYSGGLFMFKYFNPKYKKTDKLPYFDMFPLVLSLGAVTTKNGIRNLGFNLHYLPPQIRIVVLCEVFDIYKTLYRYNIFFNRSKPINIRYDIIMKRCTKYGAGFSIKMYIPSRQKEIINFPYNEWYKAIFLPSRGYYDIRADKLIQEWEKYIRKLNLSTSKNIDWRNTI